MDTDKDLILRKVERLKTDLPYYASKFFKVRPKSGGVLVPLIYNRAQMTLHKFIEKMRADRDLIRVVICKGRQQGMSTYTASRFLHRAMMNPGTSVFILAHMTDSTNYLFDMVKRMYTNLPEPLKPEIERSNRKELKFGKLDSEYALGTAGSADIGRGMNPTLLHLSEAAYFSNTDELMMGLLQGVSTDLNTEIIMESTANGVSNMFYDMCMKGVSETALSRFKTLFIPWYIQAEYSEKVPDNLRSAFRITEEEEMLKETYGLTIDQLFWRRRKIEGEYSGDSWKFSREYPMCLQDAFKLSGDTLLSSSMVDQSRKRSVSPEYTADTLAPKILGVDPSGDGKDRTTLVLRQGRSVLWYSVYSEPVKPVDLSGIISKIIQREELDMVFIDVAYGYGVHDILRNTGHSQKVMAIHFGQGAVQSDIYKNKRAEMYAELEKWFDEGMTSIPDAEEFARDLLMIPSFKVSGARGLLALPPKDEIKRDNGGVSPDIADALALTFAYPIQSRRARAMTPVNVREISVSRAASPFRSRRLYESVLSSGRQGVSNIKLKPQNSGSELYVR